MLTIFETKLALIGATIGIVAAAVLPVTAHASDGPARAAVGPIASNAAVAPTALRRSR